MATARARGGPASLSAKAPFAQCARIYHERGWLPFPLPVKKKAPPPDGITGWDADPRKINDKQIASWIGAKNPASNIGLRSPKNHMGIDIDAYKESGDETYARIVEEMGPLPETWVSSARDDGNSGIRHYRLPAGAEDLSWPGKVGGGIETVHFGHRYTVAPPSVHPEKDQYNQPQVYKWYAPGEAPSGFGSHDIPNYADLTELPEVWVDYFTKGRYAKHLPAKDLGGKASSRKAVTAWLAERAGDPCALMVSTWEKVTDDFEGGSAHDSARDGLYRLACLSAEGHAGLEEAVSRLHDYFIAEVSRDNRDGEARGMAQADTEWLRFLDGAVKKVMHRIDNGDFIGSACACTGFTPEGRPKDRLDVDNYHISEALSICYDAVRARAETDWLGMYQMNGDLREITADDMRELSVNSLRPAVARRVDWVKWAGGEEPRPKPANPPRDFLGSMLEDSTIKDELPPIRGRATSPFWAEVDGKAKLIHANGYHRGVQVFMNMDPKLEASVENMDLDPSAKWVRRAITRIDEMIEKFPFVGDADRAAFYAALILPFVRDLIAGPTPIHLIGAPVHGSGKTLLAKAISMVTCGDLNSSGSGYQLISVSKTRDGNAELEKEVTSRMRDSPRVVVIDNIAHTIDSSKLASSLTEYPNYTSRLLGGNSTVCVPNRTLWIMTANNPTASDEIADRIVPCWIDPKCERPRDRTDDFKDLYTWIPEHRPALVWSALTLVAHWVASGAADGPVKLGSFDRWAQVVSGILDCAGIEGLLDNRAEFLEKAADESDSLAGVVEQWAEHHGREEVRPLDLLALPAMEELLDTSAAGARIKLGKLLKPLVDRVVGGFVVRKRTLHGGAVYCLEAAE